METTLKVVIIGHDPSLPAEAKAAFAGISDVRVNIHHVASYRQGAESLRNRRPVLAIVEMTQDAGAFKAFVEEASIGSPDTVVVATFRSDIFGSDSTESALLIEGLRAGVQDFLRRPLAIPDVEQLVHRLQRRDKPRRKTTGQVISFISNKGGVGKSTLSVNVAAELARRHPGRVLLIDASLQMGVCAALLDVTPLATMTDVAHQRHRLDERLLQEMAVEHSSGLALLSCPNDAVEAAQVDDEVMTRVITLARRCYDFVVVDTFPMIDRVMVAILDLTDLAYMVTEAVVPTLRGTMKLVELLNQLDFPVVRRRLVVNQYASFSGSLKVSDVAARLGQSVTHVVPFDKKLLTAANVGSPLILNAGFFSGFARSIKAMVSEIESRAGSPKDLAEPASQFESGESGVTGEAR
jgi:pilus assembly protein CpaE